VKAFLKNLFKKESAPAFISGRLATRDDVKHGFFYLADKHGEPMTELYPVPIPQPVIYHDVEKKKKVRAALIQAEKMLIKDLVVCTIRLEDNSILVCRLNEVQLSKKK
jgi:hypothetical protein